jgi:hypothetical protein
MRGGIRRIPPRRRIFVGCEGEGEQGYGALLQRLADDRQQPHVFLDLHVCGGGDPLAALEATCATARQRARKYGEFAIRVLFVDSDKLGQFPTRDARINPLAARERFWIVWQRPCFEAFLLRHLPSCQSRRPPTAAAALDALRREWPEYTKPMSRMRLGPRIRLDEIRAAATVEPDLRAFLTAIGLLS